MTDSIEMVDIPASGAAGAGGVAARRSTSARAGRRVRRFTADLSAVGEPALWAFGGALALGIILIAASWHDRLERPHHLLAQAHRRGRAARRHAAGRRADAAASYRPARTCWPLTRRQRAFDRGRTWGFADRTLYKTANFDLYGDDFRWVSDFEVAKSPIRRLPLFERQQWGVFVGRIAGLTIDGSRANSTYAAMQREQSAARDRFDRDPPARAQARSARSTTDRTRATGHPPRRPAPRRGQPQAQARRRARPASPSCRPSSQTCRPASTRSATEDRRYRVQLEEVGGRTVDTELSQIVRFYPANDLSLLDKIGIYLSRWWEFLSTEPREANTQGGVLPAIFGTVAMTLMMVVFVAPFGVITALYLREYAKQGRLTSIVRISVNNLAGVPSIVYGVFGLGFFAYTMGGTIDQLFYPENGCPTRPSARAASSGPR
jgi:phosphate transport system permease protein